MFAIMMVVELEATKSVRQPWTWKSADALNGVGRQERGCRGHLLRSSHLALSFSLRTTRWEPQGPGRRRDVTRVTKEEVRPGGKKPGTLHSGMH